MIKTKNFYKCPYKEPFVLIMDMHVHISEKWFLIDLLHKMYGRAILPRDFRGKREKKKPYLIVMQGRVGHSK